MRRSENSLSIRQVILFGILGSFTFALKLGMMALPNIEPVSLLIMVFAVVFGLKALYPVYIYVVLEILYFGLGTWNVCYLYVWPILTVVAWLLRRMQGSFSWAVLSGVFGLMFGALCGIVDVFIGGLAYAVTKWAAGIPFDIAHCMGNFLMALVLFEPLRKLVEKLYARMGK